MSEEDINNDAEFYSNAVQYWSKIPATLDGMLGGFGFISQIDIKGSKLLLKQLFSSKNPPGKEYALDCGAGIGRVTKFLLSEIFEKVDMVEQNGAFLNQAKKYLGPKVSKIGHFYSEGLQTFKPNEGKYDVIWAQWVLGHLTDKDLINFLIDCRKGLKENGVIILKENVTSTDQIEKDEQDSSITRPFCHYSILFEKAKLYCYRHSKQHNFPKGLFSVYMFVLKPLENVTSTTINIDELNDSLVEEFSETRNEGIDTNNDLSIEGFNNFNSVECYDLTRNEGTDTNKEASNDLNIEGFNNFNSVECYDLTRNEGTDTNKEASNNLNIEGFNNFNSVRCYDLNNEKSNESNIEGSKDLNIEESSDTHRKEPAIEQISRIDEVDRTDIRQEKIT